jgi:hypothetical protein
LKIAFLSDKVLAITIYYYEQKGLTTYEGMSMNVVMTKVSLEQIKTKIAAL